MRLPRIGAISGLAALLSIVSGTVSAAPVPSMPDNVSQQDIRNYASALLKVLEIRSVADRAWKTAGPAERAGLKIQSQRAIYDVLARHGFTEASFNRISAAVERTPALRRRVRDLVTRESLDL